MVMLGGSKPGVGASAFMRMKPVLSELLISTAAAPAAIAFTTCARRQTDVGYRSNRILQHDRRTYTFTCNTPQKMNTKCQPYVLLQVSRGCSTLDSKEQLPRWSSTALFLYSDGRLNGVQPSSGSTAASVSGAKPVEATSPASDDPKPASMTVYALPSAPLPCV